ncbi:hypothetical protein ACFPOE_08680 [Caenimonas terrae]|uniref:BcpO-related WXXGXW repeat protein n=1 Tax=Caenimonas terrae TaxID=696074 RepID=A0ABW0NCH3_9BURK
MINKTFAVAVLAAAAAGALVPMAASADTYTIVRVAPPAPIVETVPAARHGWVWAPGYYDYRDNQYVWVQGHWMRERPGHEWREARWVEMGNGQWRRVGGNWERGPYGDRDHDGIPNRYDHYRNHARGPYGDRDGDGVLNKDDRYPNNPNRS